MKIPRITLLLVGILLTAVSLRAADLSDNRITIFVTAIAMPKDQAMRFISQRQLDTAPAEGLKELEKLVEQKQAESVANPAITLQNGMRGLNESGGAKLDVASNMMDGAIDTELVFDYLGEKLTTSVRVKSGDAVFLGALDSQGEGKSATHLIFARILASK